MCACYKQTRTGRKRALLDLWFMSDSRLNWLQQLSDCWPSICCGQSKLQLLRGSRGPSVFQSSADKSNLTPWFSPHSPLPGQHRKRLPVSGAISPEIEMKWFMSARHGMQDSWLRGDECLWSHGKQRLFFVGMKMKVKLIWIRKMYDVIFWCTMYICFCVFYCGCLWNFSTSGALWCYETEQKFGGKKTWDELGILRSFEILSSFSHLHKIRNLHDFFSMQLQWGGLELSRLVHYTKSYDSDKQTRINCPLLIIFISSNRAASLWMDHSNWLCELNQLIH